MPRAKGKYIAFCEGDDFWTDPTKLEKQSRVLDSNNDVSLVYSNAVTLENGERSSEQWISTTRDLSSAELLRGPNIYTLTSVFRNVIDFPYEANFTPYGDMFLWSRLGRFGRGVFVEDVLPCVYRRHPGGRHSGSGPERRRKMHMHTLYMMQIYYDRLGDNKTASYFEERITLALAKHYGVREKVMRINRYILSTRAAGVVMRVWEKLSYMHLNK